MSFDLHGKVALVTGGSTGIGRAAALGLAEAGAHVALTFAQHESEAREAADRIGSMGRRGMAIRADASIESAVEASVKETLAVFGRIDVLVNNAGSLIERKPVEEMTIALWDRVLAVNLTSAFLYSRAVLPTMRQQGWGRIINVTSVAARTGGGVGAVAYAAAKAGLSTFTRGLAREVAGSGITVNGVAPGVIATPFHDRFTPREGMARMVASIPLGRAGSPDEVVGALLYLASDLSRYVTGEIIEINGGMLMS